MTDASTPTPGRLGTADRAIRLALGATALGFALFCPWAAALGAPVQIVSGLAGLVLVLTAFARFCLLYRLLGVCTG